MKFNKVLWRLSELKILETFAAAFWFEFFSEECSPQNQKILLHTTKHRRKTFTKRKQNEKWEKVKHQQ